MERRIVTHYGWFGICPVYLGDVDSDCMLVVERHWSLLPLFWLSEQLQKVAILVRSLVAPYDEPYWRIYVGDRLPYELEIGVR